MRVKPWIVASTVSTWLLTLLTPLTTFGQIPSNIPEQSCNGVGSPLTKNDVVELAGRLGIENTGNKVEYAFETFALESLGLPKYIGMNIPSPLRRIQSGGKAFSVKPDSIGDIVTVPLVDGLPQAPKVYPNSLYVDAKLKKGSISPTYSDYQTPGFLDALSRSPAGESKEPLPLRPNPRLYFLTSSDTKIGRQVIVQANKFGIAIIQHVVCKVPDGSFGINDLVIGKGIILNPKVLIGRPVPLPIDTFTFSSGIPGSLEKNTPPPTPPTPPTPCGGSGC